MELKYLTEKRAENQEEMQNLLNAAKLEKRALTEDEITKLQQQTNYKLNQKTVNKLKQQIDQLTKQLDEKQKELVRETLFPLVGVCAWDI